MLSRLARWRMRTVVSMYVMLLCMYVIKPPPLSSWSLSCLSAEYCEMVGVLLAGFCLDSCISAMWMLCLCMKCLSCLCFVLMLSMLSCRILSCLCVRVLLFVLLLLMSICGGAWCGIGCGGALCCAGVCMGCRVWGCVGWCVIGVPWNGGGGVGGVLQCRHFQCWLQSSSLCRVEHPRCHHCLQWPHCTELLFGSAPEMFLLLAFVFLHLFLICHVVVADFCLICLMSSYFYQHSFFFWCCLQWGLI